MSTQMSFFPEHQFYHPESLRDFILAGRAKFTVRSEKTLKHFTYKVKKEKDTSIWYVHRLIANGQYMYLGTIFDDHQFKATRKTPHWVRGDPSFLGFAWLWERLRSKEWPKGVTIYHEARCGMCGIELTDPISIKEGYGPDCRKKRLNRTFEYGKV